MLPWQQPDLSSGDPLEAYNKGPLWLRAIGGAANGFIDRLAGTPDPSLSPEEQAYSRQRQRQAVIGQLLASANPQPQGTPLIAPIAPAMQAAQQAGDQYSQGRLKSQLERAQIQALQNKQKPSPFADLQPDKYTPDSLASFQKSASMGA